MDFSQLNDVCRGINFVPTKSRNQLDVGTNSNVTGMKIIKTKLRESIVVTMNVEFTVFLPSRIVKFLLNNPKAYRQMVQTTNDVKLNIHYIGRQYGECEFIDIE
ncbi:hypothetical protein PV325_006841 [Microctonus aethiopoides]|nr:hypothetical protein PV325_006841 [Microctonus aethiopoides]